MGGDTEPQGSSLPEPHQPPDSSDLVLPADALEPASLADLSEVIRRAAAASGWSDLTPVQARSIPYVLAGRDLVVQSRTGSGKTGAYVLPLLDRLDANRRECQALILAPTRELAVQVGKEVRRLGGEAGLDSIEVYGGTAYGPQLDAFRRGAQVVVGTPGRILDHLMRGSLKLDALRVLVFDEADRLMSMGFYPDMRRIRSYVPESGLTAYMFSATIGPEVRRLSDQFLTEPEFLSLSSDQIHVAAVDHISFAVEEMRKDRDLVRLLEVLNPPQALIFCNRRQKVEFVTVVLRRFGFDADRLTSELNQKARERVLNRFRDGKLRYLVATDVAARGIDVADLGYVVQYDVPEDPETYVHRSGRTGRAGAGGVAMCLVSGLQRLELIRICKRYGVNMEEREIPSRDEVGEVVAERVTALLEAELRERGQVEREGLERMIPLARRLAESEDELAVIAMLLDDFYRESLKGQSGEEGQRDGGGGDRPGGGGGGDRPRRPRRRRRRRGR